MGEPLRSPKGLLNLRGELIMKKMLMMLIVVTMMAFTNYCGNHYTVQGYISDISAETIELTDDFGQIWTIDYEKGYEKGDCVKITFFDFEDCDRKNDAVTKVRKIRK